MNGNSWHDPCLFHHDRDICIIQAWYQQPPPRKNKPAKRKQDEKQDTKTKTENRKRFCSAVARGKQMLHSSIIFPCPPDKLHRAPTKCCCKKEFSVSKRNVIWNIVYCLCVYTIESEKEQTSGWDKTRIENSGAGLHSLFDVRKTSWSSWSSTSFA